MLKRFRTGRHSPHHHTFKQAPQSKVCHLCAVRAMGGWISGTGSELPVETSGQTYITSVVVRAVSAAQRPARTFLTQFVFCTALHFYATRKGTERKGREGREQRVLPCCTCAYGTILVSTVCRFASLSSCPFVTCVGRRVLRPHACVRCTSCMASPRLA